MNQSPLVAKVPRPVPTLADVVQGRCGAESLPRDVLPSILGQLETLKWELTVQLTNPQIDSGKSPEDRLLDVREASGVLGMSVDYLYRNASKLPFTVRVGRKLQFSRLGIDKFIKARAGR